MIASFRSRLAEDVYNGVISRYSRKLPLYLHRKAQRLLDQVNAVTVIDTLNIPPSNKLCKLKGDLFGYWRIKIDRQWAIIFRWFNGEAFDVDIVDYH